MAIIVTEHEENPPESVHDQWEEGIDKEVSSMEEDMWIYQREALQISIPQSVSPQSPTNSNQSGRVQDIVKEDLRLRFGEFGV